MRRLEGSLQGHHAGALRVTTTGKGTSNEAVNPFGTGIDEKKTDKYRGKVVRITNYKNELIQNIFLL